MKGSFFLTPLDTTMAVFARNLPLPRWSSIGLTVWLTVLSVVIALVPSADDWLQFDRSAIAAGEWWRIISGHFTHWGAGHLGWDLSVFAALGVIYERTDRRRFVIGLFTASLLIPLATWMFLPALETYRGLSGLDTTLFTLLAASAFKTNWREKQWGWVIAIVGLLASLAAKIGFETMTNGALFVDTASAGFQPVPLAHVTGALVGLIVGIYPGSGCNETFLCAVFVPRPALAAARLPLSAASGGGNAWVATNQQVMESRRSTPDYSPPTMR